MLRHISVDITNILAFQFNAAGGCDVYGKVVELMDDQVQVHGWRGADGPYGNGLPLLGIGEGETVVDTAASEVLPGGGQVLFGDADGLEGIKDFFHMIPGKRQVDGDAPGLAADIHRQPCPNHLPCPSPFRGIPPRGQACRQPLSWRTIGA